MKILVIAFACEPGHGSEPGLGWNFVDEVSRTQPVWLITHASHREPLDRYLRESHRGHPIHVTYCALPRGFEWLWSAHAGLNIYYYVWQIFAARLARQLHRTERFDLAQHVSYARYWMPSAGSRVGVPFIWGPVSGGEVVPRAFWSGISWKARLGQMFCNVVRIVMEKDPALRSNVRAVDIALGGTPESVERLKRLGLEHVELMSAIALPEGVVEPYEHLSPPEDGKFRIVSVGKIAAWRGNHLAIEALARSGLTDATLTIIGQGPDRPRLETIARQLGVSDRVIFAGGLSHGDGLRVVAQSHMLVHPTLRDSGGVIAEALTLGKPVLCLDLGTPAVVVDATCGLKVAATSPDEVVAAFASAMRRWSDDSAAYAALSAGARVRAGELSRERRMARLYKLYDLALRRRQGQGNAATGCTPAGECDPVRHELHPQRDAV